MNCRICGASPRGIRCRADHQDAHYYQTDDGDHRAPPLVRAGARAGQNGDENQHGDPKQARPSKTVAGTSAAESGVYRAEAMIATRGWKD